MDEATSYEVVGAEEIPTNHAEVGAYIDGIEWDVFNEFTCLGSLANVIPFIKDAPCRASLEVLGGVNARLKGHRSHASAPSLYVYLALSVSDVSKVGDVSGSELHDFYKHVFHSTLREDNMHNFFRQHATVMIIRRCYYRKASFRLEIVGALTFSRPTNRVPTYLAYVAVSNGRHSLLSLSDMQPHTMTSNAFAPDDKLVGYRGRGLGSLLVCMMEVLVTKSWRVDHASLPCRVPYPECFLHYNSNNADSGDGWLARGFLPLYGVTECSADEIANVRARYDILARSLHGCNIFKASHLDRENSTTM